MDPTTHTEDPLAPIVKRPPYLRTALIAIVVAVLAAAGYLLLRNRTDNEAPKYRTEAVSRGSLVVTVSATGNLQPTNKVDVGSEISGTMEAVYVDDNDRVKKGQVIARLDLTKLNAQVEKSRAALRAAEAKVAQTRATLQEAQANLQRLRDVSALSGGKVPSKAEMATGEATLARAHADEASAVAAVAEARATLASDETSVRKASIRSPIDGVVLTRKVDPGQTVAASLQAPVLFTIAENLRQMELQVDVDEADVGQVREGQKAMFRVDAYPARQYPASIMRVGYGSQTKEGVVTYPTLLKVNNDDLSLRPGMTATAQITTVTRDDALLVPNAALRYTPPAADDAKKKGSESIVGQLIPRPPREAAKTRAAAKGAEQQVWALRGLEAVPVRVTVGASNGRYTEVTGGDLQVGMLVILESTGASRN